MPELPGNQARTEAVPESVVAAVHDVGRPDHLGIVLDDIQDYAIFMIDLEGRIASWNTGSTRVKGYEPHEAIGQPFSMLFTPQDAARGQPEHEMAVALERGVYQGEGVRVRKDGSLFDAEVTLRLITDDLGHARGFVKITRDVTHRRQLERLLAERAEFEKQLLGIVSHDLKSPLHAILMSANALLRHKMPAETEATTVARIVSSAERAVRLIDQLLDFTQARLSGRLSTSPQPLELHEFVDLVIEELRVAHPTRDIVTEHAGEGAVVWDPDRIAQLITNLTANALAHGAPGDPVHVRTRNDDSEVVIEVHNVGEPIPPELMPRIFEPLRQGDAKRPGSIGLGLFIARRVAEAHGGTLVADSDRERGTTFVARMPRTAPAAAEDSGIGQSSN